MVWIHDQTQVLNNLQILRIEDLFSVLHELFTGFDIVCVSIRLIEVVSPTYVFHDCGPIVLWENSKKEFRQVVQYVS